MEYCTEKDLIKYYTSKRKTLNEEDVKEVLDCFISYFNKVTQKINNEDIAYRIRNFGTVYDKDFNTSDLVNFYNSTSRIRAEKKLQEYIITGIIKPKKINIKDDKLLRI